MSEKKNIVIKVKYPTPGNTGETSHSMTGRITEWNLKRIGLTLGCLVLAIITLFKIMGTNDNSQPETVVQLNLPEQPLAEIKPNTPINDGQLSKVINVSATDKQVVRAQLTSKIDRNEPGNNIDLPIKISRKETIGIYYFAEIKGMKGKAVYHEWLLNDNPISRKKVNISADPWRTSSKQVISYTMNNDWKVRIVDESGKILTEKAFSLELK